MLGVGWLFGPAGFVVGAALVAWVAQRRLRRVAQEMAQCQLRSERERIATDLHDGVGARLTVMLASPESAQPNTGHRRIQLLECYLDLQATVDDLSCAMGHSVMDGLARLRHRIAPALAQQGIALEWHVESVGTDMEPKVAREICKIAQESLSNVLRHSHANRARLRWGADVNGELILEVEDNGRGYVRSATATQSGHGLRSMRQRAREIGARLSIAVNVPGGVKLHLHWSDRTH